MQDILIFGKSGQVGRSLLELFQSNIDLHAFDSKDADFTNEYQIRELIQKIKPKVIINAAAYTAVDKAESDEALAFKVNAEAVKIIGEEATNIGASVIHFSSDYVFDGTKKGTYVEADRARPSSVYGSSKLKGEDLLLKTCKHSIILRTSWVVSHYGENFLKTIIKLAKKRDVLHVVTDQHGVPTSANLLAEVSKILTEKLLSDPEKFPYGVYHLTPTGDTTWFDYAKFVIREAIKRGEKFKLDLDSIYPIEAQNYPLPARRPKNSLLNTSHIRNTFDLTLPSWQEGILDIMDQLYKR